MLDIIGNILGVVKSLLGMSDQLRAAQHQRRADMATLFEKISTCLATVSSEIRMGNVPHGRCNELITYAQELPAVISKEVGDAKATELGITLHSSYNVEQLAVELKNASDKEPHLKQIEEASGKFQALANIVRAK